MQGCPVVRVVLSSFLFTFNLIFNFNHVEIRDTFLLVVFISLTFYS